MLPVAEREIHPGFGGDSGYCGGPPGSRHSTVAYRTRSPTGAPEPTQRTSAEHATIVDSRVRLMRHDRTIGCGLSKRFGRPIDVEPFMPAYETDGVGSAVSGRTTRCRSKLPGGKIELNGRPQRTVDWMTLEEVLTRTGDGLMKPSTGSRHSRRGNGRTALVRSPRLQLRQRVDVPVPLPSWWEPPAGTTRTWMLLPGHSWRWPPPVRPGCHRPQSSLVGHGPGAGPGRAATSSPRPGGA